MSSGSRKFYSHPNSKPVFLVGVGYTCGWVFVTEISVEEKKLLIGYVRTSPLRLVRLKAQAVLLAGKAMSDEDIADVLGRKQRTVTLWRRDWLKNV